MKKIIVSTLATLMIFTAAPNGATASGPIPVTTQINGDVRQVNLFPLANNKVLVTWVDFEGPSAWLRTRVVKNTSTILAQNTVNSAAASYDWGRSIFPNITKNAKNQFFATWTVNKSTGDQNIQSVLGATSNDGVSWSDPFSVIPDITFAGSPSVCERESEMLDCGFTAISSAIDDQGKLAVIFSRKLSETKERIFAVATSNKNSWPTPTILGTVGQLRDVNIVGLTKGFATNYMNYGSASNCSIYVNFYGWGKSTWTKTQRASWRPVNTVVNSRWVQRDSELLTLVMGSEITSGGIYMRNFDVAKGAWSGLSREIQPAKPSIVYQNIRVGTVGEKLFVSYVTFNQITAQSTLILSSQDSNLSNVVTKVALKAKDQIDQVGFTATALGEGAFTFNTAGKGYFVSLKSAKARLVDTTLSHPNLDAAVATGKGSLLVAFTSRTDNSVQLVLSQVALK